MQSVVLHIIAGLLKAAGFVLRVVPVRRRVAFLSRQGREPSLDFRLLSEALAERYPNVEQAFCLTDPETKGVVGFMGNTVRQMLLAQTSSVVVVDGYVPAVSVPARRAGVAVVQMWHSLGAVKKFGYECLDTPEGRSSLSARVLRMHRNYSCVVAGGPWATESLARAFDCSPAIVKPMGLPRLDYLVSERFAGQRAEVREKILRGFPQLSNGKSNVLYAPTFRRGEDAFAFRQTVANAQVIAAHDVNFIVAGHPLDDSGGKAVLPGNAIVARGWRTIDLLMVADAMITDYSAIVYEALTCGVPVYYFVPDIEGYRESPGLNEDPLAMYPQCCAQGMEQVLNMVREGTGRTPAGLEIPRECTAAIAELVGSFCS